MHRHGNRTSAMIGSTQGARMARAAAAALTVLLFSAGQASAQDSLTVGPGT